MCLLWGRSDVNLMCGFFVAEGKIKKECKTFADHYLVKWNTFRKCRKCGNIITQPAEFDNE